MKRFLFALFVAVFALVGCGKDPVVADIEAFNTVGNHAFKDVAPTMASLNERTAVAKTNEEKAAILGELVTLMNDKSKMLGDFKAKTPEVGKISEAITGGFKSAAEGAAEAQAAMLHNSQDELGSATRKITNGQTLLRQGMEDFMKLAQEKGVKLNK
ncbi:hypothetical protein [Uliginosibacterium gangwonense]|uniref:hypothetical protein n=1 Tax=Uliginosibacterium gangwonense TaxID=392736 RepID=UPI000363D2EF|nr:hypothetical protein [Uliginosibacterium gangwonense]